MFGEGVRRRRQRLGLTQAQLAEAAGMSRQMLSAVEAGRHLPRIDSGLALATALGTTVEVLLAGHDRAVGLDGAPPPDGPVRLATVGQRTVAVPAGLTDEGWSPADAIVRDGRIDVLGGSPAGLLVMGCDPVLGLLAGGSDAAWPIIAVPGSSGRAADGLAAGLLHAGVVHGPDGQLATSPPGVRRIRLSRWRVGLSCPDPRGGAAWSRVLDGQDPVVQRDSRAGAQQGLLRAIADAGGPPPRGPVATGHLDAARRSLHTGTVAVTIEPVAIALGLAFHPLEDHVAELWLSASGEHDQPVDRIAQTALSTRVQRRLATVGGYDLSDAGSTVLP